MNEWAFTGAMWKDTDEFIVGYSRNVPRWAVMDIHYCCDIGINVLLCDMRTLTGNDNAQNQITLTTIWELGLR